MDILVNDISLNESYFSYLLMVLLLFLALVSAPWYKIRDSGAQHVYFGAIALITILWQLRADLSNGFNFHMLGASLLFLLFGWEFALFATLVIVGVNFFITGIPVDLFALNWLIQGAFPVFFTMTSLYLVQRFLPHNFFIYIFINAFFTTALALYSSGALSALWFSLHNVYSGTILTNQYLTALILMMVPEAICTGMVLTLLVVYKPTWVATFHDAWYLKGK